MLLRSWLTWCGLALAVAPALASGCAHAAGPASPPLITPAASPVPLAIGETFHLDSNVLAERRVINVYLPPGYRDGGERYPVLYMPDGGVKEDFPHILGIVDVSIKTQVMRPFILVGIENTGIDPNRGWG